jgi:hypothetical protein
VQGEEEQERKRRQPVAEAPVQSLLKSTLRPRLTYEYDIRTYDIQYHVPGMFVRYVPVRYDEKVRIILTVNEEGEGRGRSSAGRSETVSQSVELTKITVLKAA